MDAKMNPEVRISQTTSPGSPRFLVRGESELYQGKHYLGTLGGFLPATGGYGRLSEERCQALFRYFDTRQEAQEHVDRYNELKDRPFTMFVEEAS